MIARPVWGTGTLEITYPFTVALAPLHAVVFSQINTLEEWMVVNSRAWAGAYLARAGH